MLCFGDQATAQLAARNFLKRRPDLVQDYQQAYTEYAARGLKSAHPANYAQRLALASHLFRLGDLTA
jgi:hypothetical protein